MTSSEIDLTFKKNVQQHVFGLNGEHGVTAILIVPMV